MKQYIALPHPNRPGVVRKGTNAIVVHYTGNDKPHMDDVHNVKYMSRAFIKKENKYYEIDGVTDFRYGSAQVFIDMDSFIETMPLYEVAYGCGDQHYPLNNGYKGRTKLAHYALFDNPNQWTLNIELCNNDVIKDSTEDWDKTVANGIDYIRQYLKENNLKIDVMASMYPNSVGGPSKVGEVILARHYDITGKICPKPFVDDQEAWYKFLRAVSG
jgi:N-acetylmuramoyl-L-alanine amidase